MQIKTNVRMLYSRVQTMLRQRRRKQLDKTTLEISAPFDLKREPVCLPGLSEDELSMYREKAAASRIGIAETKIPRSPVLAYTRPPPIVKVMSPNATTATTIPY